jgi:hypothetical protein
MVLVRQTLEHTKSLAGSVQTILKICSLSLVNMIKFYNFAKVTKKLPDRLPPTLVRKQI